MIIVGFKMIRFFSRWVILDLELYCIFVDLVIRSHSDSENTRREWDLMEHFRSSKWVVLTQESDKKYH